MVSLLLPLVRDNVMSQLNSEPPIKDNYTFPLHSLTKLFQFDSFFFIVYNSGLFTVSATFKGALPFVLNFFTRPSITREEKGACYEV